MLRKQLHNIIFQKQVFSGGSSSNPNEGTQQPPSDHFCSTSDPNMPNTIQRI